MSALRNHKDVEFSLEEAEKVVFPENLTIAHFYASFGATTALRQCPSDWDGLMRKSYDGKSAL